MSRQKKLTADWFEHIATFRKRSELLAIRSRFKFDGYAIYTMLLEILCESPFYKISDSDISLEVIAADIGIIDVNNLPDHNKLREYLQFFVKIQCFTYSNGFYSSEYLKEVLQKLNEKRRTEQEKYKNSFLGHSDAESPLNETEKGHSGTFLGHSDAESPLNETEKGHSGTFLGHSDAESQINVPKKDNLGTLMSHSGSFLGHSGIIPVINKQITEYNNTGNSNNIHTEDCISKNENAGNENLFSEEEERKVELKVEPKSLKKEKKSSASKYDQLITSSHYQSKNYFLEFYKQKCKKNYVFSGRDGKALNEILIKIGFIMRNDGIEPTEETLPENFMVFLGKMNHGWVLENLSLSIINQKFNEILQQITNGKSKNGSGKAGSGISQDYLSDIFTRLSSEKVQG